MSDTRAHQNGYGGMFETEFDTAIGPGGVDADPYAFAVAGGAEPLFPTAPESVSPPGDVYTVTAEPYATTPYAAEPSTADPFASGPAATPVLPPQPPAQTPTQPTHRTASAKPAAKPSPHTEASRGSERAFEQRFAVIGNLMQHGAWPQALEQLQALSAEYPRVASLHALIEEATLKADLMETWAHKIKGRRLTVGQEWLLRRSLPFLLVFGLFLTSAIYYQNFVAPLREVVAMAQAIQTQIDQARELAQLGDYRQALDLYEGVLARDPDNPAAYAGRTETRRLLALSVNYDVALQVAEAGNLPRALRIMQGVQATSPTFRDVGAQLGRLTGLAQAEKVFQAAEKAAAQHRWIDAVQGYAEVKLLNPDYRADEVYQRLQDGYFYAGQAILARWPDTEIGPEQARDYLRQAQAAATKGNLDGVAIEAELADLDVYFQGDRAMRRDDLLDAVNVWLGLYDRRPAYLGGYLAEEIYRAYLTVAAQAIGQGNLTYARELYESALAMDVADNSEAQTQLQSLANPTPTPAPTPLPAPVYEAPPVAAAAPPPTATPTPAPAYQGWIAFRSTRDGGEAIYMMRADGSDQQRAADDVASRFAELTQSEPRAPDGRVAFVQTATGRSDANIAIRSSDGQGVTTATNYTGSEYDPAWSPNGQWIVFVANHTGNDEVWRMNSDGSDARQLTWNNWEWDKHPTFSPDSSQIAFFSNRTGARQIWVMSNDGSGQHNLSNNTYDDWDPIWLK